MLNSLFEKISHYNGIVNGIVWGVPMLCLILGVGVFYAIRTRLFQIKRVIYIVMKYCCHNVKLI